MPKQLTLENTYDFSRDVPEKLYDFLRNALGLRDFLNGAKIITFPKPSNRKYYVTEGQIGNDKIILKRLQNNTLRDILERFYSFMDAVKQKLRILAAIENDDSLSEEEKISHIQYIRNQLAGLGNIVPIIGITKTQKQNKLSSENSVDEMIEISPKVDGHTLYDCILKRLPPYDTPTGTPRNQDIAINLLRQLNKATIVLHSCGYKHGDYACRNVMIVQNGPSFTPKLIDWGNLKKIKSPLDLIDDYRQLSQIFIQILLGKQCPEAYKSPPETWHNNPHDLEKTLNNLQKTGIYSPRTIDTFMQLFRDILANDEKEPKVEAIILKLEALLADNKSETEENGANDENPNESDERKENSEEQPTDEGEKT